MSSHIRIVSVGGTDGVLTFDVGLEAEDKGCLIALHQQAHLDVSIHITRGQTYALLDMLTRVLEETAAERCP